MNGRQSQRRRRDIWGCILGGGILAIIGIVLVIFFLIGGKTTIKNENNSVERIQSLTCEASMEYPLLGGTDARKEDLKINVTLGNDELKAISLVYKLFYDDTLQIEASNIDNRISMNYIFSADGLKSDSLGITYSALSDAAQVSLYGKKNDISSVTAKYFMLDGDGVVFNLDSIKKHYEDIGFLCVVKQ